MLPTTLRDGAYVPKRVKEEIDFDGPIERGAKKIRAQRVQEFLTLNGFSVSIDADFGPATEKRVRDFQTARGLPASGIVNTKTHEELVAPIVKALNPIAAGGKSLSALAAAYAKQHIEPTAAAWPAVMPAMPRLLNLQRRRDSRMAGGKRQAMTRRAAR